MAEPKELKSLVRDLEAAGWRVVDRGPRYMLYSPDGATIVVAHKTPSDRRWHKNLLRDLRTGGYDPK